MNRIPTIFLKTVIILIAAISLIALIKFPQTEGRAVNLDLISIYTDPFIIYIYISSIPFFFAIYQTFKLLNLIDANKFFSHTTIKSLKTIKKCSISIITLAILSEAYLFIFERSKSDDPAGGIMTGLLIIIISLTITATTSIFQKLVQNQLHA